MTPETPGDPSQPADGLQFVQLTESHRFDGELAELLTQFQYREDEITLTAANPRPLPATRIEPPTAGVDAVFEAGSSLVFVCYDDRTHTMVNPIETALIDTLTTAIQQNPQPHSDGGERWPLGEEPTVASTDAHTQSLGSELTGKRFGEPLTMGVVTPHNAQRGALETALPDSVTANTVEKYQGGQRDIIAVSATVSDPQFARQEDRFILNPRRLLVAISRSKLLTIVVCSTALFEVAPQDSKRLADGPIWARLFTQAVGRDVQPAWDGSLGAFVGDEATEYASVPVQVHPSTIGEDLT